MKSANSQKYFRTATAFMVATSIASLSHAYKDSFEGAQLGTFWTTIEQSGTVSLSTDHARTGSQSLKLSSTPGDQREVGIFRQFSRPMYGVFSVWVYDTAPGQQTLYCRMMGDVWNVGIEDYLPDKYQIGAPGSGLLRPVNRSAGWHKFTYVVTKSETVVLIDAVPYYRVVGDFPTTRLDLRMFGPAWRPDATYYLDDFEWSPVVPAYRLTDLGRYQDRETLATDINDQGQIVGVDYSRFLGLKWNGTSWAQIPESAGRVWAINEQGHMAGDSGGGGALIWNPNRTFLFNGQSYGWAMNDNDVVVGDVRGATIQPFKWESGTFTVLPGLGGSGQALGVNNDGTIVGGLRDGSGLTKAVSWTGGSLAVLPDLGGNDAQAYCINSQGWIGGWSNTLDINDYRATLFSNGNVGDLGKLAGSTLSQPWTVTADGLSGGRSMVTGDLFATIWNNGTVRKCDDLVRNLGSVRLTEVFGSNVMGQLVGVTYRGSAHGGFLLDPTDTAKVEPDSFRIVRGRLEGGNVRSLANIDGDVLRTCRFIVPNQLVPPVELELDGWTMWDSPSEIELRFVSRVATAGAFSQRLELFDHVSGAWDVANGRSDTIGTNFQVVSLFGAGNLARYVNSATGSLKARVRVSAVGPTATVMWCHEADQAVWWVSP